MNRTCPAMGTVLMIGLFAAACRAEGPGPQDVQGADDTQALRAEVGRLRQEVNSLRRQIQATSPSAATQPSAPDAPPFDEALRDAERRESHLDVSGVSAGWSEDRGFFIRSDDDQFLLSPFVLLQVRGATALRQNALPGGGDDTQSGFEIRRLQFGLDGHLIDPDLTYRIFWQSSELTSGNLSLLMAWVQYRFHGTPWVIGGGQFKDPLDHEQLISDAKQLASDRTYVDDQLAGGEAFSRGVTLRYDDHGPLRGEAAFTSGFNVPNVSFQSFPTNPASYGLAARIEYKLLGNWRDYEQFSSQQNHANLLVIGGGIDYTEAGHTDSIRTCWTCNSTPALSGSMRLTSVATPVGTPPVELATRMTHLCAPRPVTPSREIGKPSADMTTSISTDANSKRRPNPRYTRSRRA